MATIDLKFAGYPAQLEFIADPRRFVAFIGGIGSGKSYAGALRSLTIATKRPCLGFVTAPTYQMLRDSTIRTFQEIADPLIAKFNRSEYAMQLINGSEILFRSADEPERLRGFNAYWWWADEAALYSDRVWQIGVGRLRQFGAGYAHPTTTPAGRNWLWQRFIQQPSAQHTVYHASTLDSPFLPEEFITGLQEEYTGDFARQEIGGEFVLFEGLIYPDFSERVHIADSVPGEFKTVVAGVDWGLVNPGVIQVVGLTGDGRAYLIHEEYARQRGIDAWRDIAVQLRKDFKIDSFVCDPSEPGNITAFQAAGLPAFKADNEVLTGIQAVTRRLHLRADNVPGLLLSRSARHTVAEFQQYQWLKRGDISMDKPVKANDHCLDALRYAIMDLDTLREFKPSTVQIWE